MATLIKSDYAPSERRRWNLSLIVSAAIHASVLLGVFWHVAPIFVRPVLPAKGSGGDSTPISTALYFPKQLATATAATPVVLSFPRTAHNPPQKSKLWKRRNSLDNAKSSTMAEAGSPFGSTLEGVAEGDEVKQGFAIVFAPPRIAPWELPNGMEGDVVIELTIDAQGNVVQEKLLQGLGHGIDEKVIATLRDWRFRPATRNGVPIPFKYDAHFHFPS